MLKLQFPQRKTQESCSFPNASLHEKKIGAIIKEKGVSIFCKGGDFMQGLYKLALVGTKQQLTDFLKKVNDNDPDSVFNEYAVEECSCVVK